MSFTLEGFKHIPLQFIDAFSNGSSIRIGLHQTYRTMEGRRGDRLEGVAEYAIDRLEPRHERLPEFAAARAAIGFPEGVGPGHNFVYQNNTIRYIAPPSYLFCCSSEADFARCGPHAEGIVRIKNLRTLAGLLRAARPDLLGQWRGGPVEYQARSVNPFREGLLAVDPFHKSHDFAFENELRISWETVEEGTPDYLDLKAPLAVALFERIA